MGLQIVMKYGRSLPTVALPMSVNKFVTSAPKPNMKTRKIVLEKKTVYDKVLFQYEFIVIEPTSPSSMERPS